MTTSTSTSPGNALRGLLASASGAVGVAGGGTPLEARCAAAAGFESFYVSGYATAAWRYGVPDVGLIGMREIVENVSAITTAQSLPVIVDADTGYGEAANVAMTVRLLEQAGAAAVQIEDQVWPKRCGHMDGKSVIGTNEMVRKVRAAVLSRNDPSTVIIARTDARSPLGLQEAIDRGNRYLDAGADAIFVDAPESVDELAAIAKAVSGWLVANMSESGKTPILPLNELGDLGYKIVIYPTSALRLSAALMSAMFADLRANGATGAWAERMMSLHDVNELLGLAALRRLDAEVLSSAADGD